MSILTSCSSDSKKYCNFDNVNYAVRSKLTDLADNQPDQGTYREYNVLINIVLFFFVFVGQIEEKLN